MNTLIERISDNKVKLTIEVDLPTWQAALDKAFEKKNKEVKVDGFRPGKLPKQSYINRFGYESLYEEALNEVFMKTYSKAIVEHDVRVVSDPQIDLDFENLSPDTGFAYTAEVYVVPVVHLGEYLGVKVKPLSKEVTEEDLENEIKELLQSKGENVIKEEAAALGDTVVIDFEGFVDDVAFEGGKAENYPLELGSNSFIPGFEEQLVGLKTGDEKDINVTFPTNYHEHLAGKDATFKIKVHEVKTKVYPDWNDELVAELAIENVNTVEEHRAYLKENLTKAKTDAYEDHLVKSLVQEVVNNATVDIPTNMINDVAENIKENVKKQAKQYQIPFELYLQYMGLTPEQFNQEADKYAVQQIKEDLVIDEIIKHAQITVSDEEIEQEYGVLADHFKKDVKEVKTTYVKDRVKDQVERNKVINLIKENAILD